MASVSRESYAAAVERLDGYVTGDRPVALAGVADEILAVAELLERQPRLRRALSDPARTGTDRAELLGSLLEGKVSADTADLLAHAGGRPVVGAGRAARTRSSGSASRRCWPARTRPATWPRWRTSCSGSGRS